MIQTQDQFFKVELAKVWDLLHNEKSKRQTLNSKYKQLKANMRTIM